MPFVAVFLYHLLLAKIQTIIKPTNIMAKKNTAGKKLVEKPPKAADNCLTPPPVYDAVLAWAKQHLNIADRPIVRPFCPGGNYKRFDYPEGCIVVDNPPFSIFAKIVDFYIDRGISFLLFAPALMPIRPGCSYIGCGMPITYESGDVVNTSFVTNMLGDLICLDDTDFYTMVREADKLTQKQHKEAKKLWT